MPRGQGAGLGAKRTGWRLTAGRDPMEELWTVAKWCKLMGGDRHTLAAKIEAVGLPARGVGAGRVGGAKLYHPRELLAVILGGDLDAERLRKTREEADRLALANARTRGELVEIAAVKCLGAAVLGAVRNRILSFPLTDEEKDTCLRELLALGDMDWSREAR